MENALSQIKIKENVFGVSFAPGNLEFHFGGMNTELYSNPEYHRVITPPNGGKAYWLLGNAQVFVGDFKVLGGLQTIICTNSLLTWGPRAQVIEIYKQIRGSEPDSRLKGLYKFPCTEEPKVKFSWDGQERWEYLR